MSRKGAALDLPASLRPSSTLPFVGRSSELETLRTLLPTAAGEGRRFVLLGGEPGSGKSRLVRELARGAASDGALVAYGACDAVIQAPYGPFAEVLERLAGALEPGQIRAALGAGAGELSRLLPDLATVLGELPTSTSGDPDTERHRLHIAVGQLLEVVGAGQPVLLVIEDIHWADVPTLLLLRHLGRATAGARVLVLATFRDTETEMPGELAQTLADLRRADDVVRIRLSGLSDGEVAEFVSRASEGELVAELQELAAAIADVTGGNPFLICELWRAVVETKLIDVVNGGLQLTRPLTELGTPESVREVVSQRLARLAPKTIMLLELAATAGAEFELAVARRGSGLDEPELHDALGEALRSGFIEELSGHRLAYRFTHELVRRAVYDRLTALRRAELHLAVGEAKEAAEGRSARALADLAYHFAAAAPLGESERGIEYNLLAARAAAEGLALDEAARCLRTALELGIEDPAERAEVLLALGDASHKAGKAPDALDAFDAAAEIARDRADAELLARAAIGYEEACWRPGTAARAARPLEEATTALGERSPGLRVGLLSGLARTLDMQGDQQRGVIVRTNAIALARRSGDSAALAKVLVRSYWSRGQTPLEEILEMLSEAKAIGEELGDIELQAEATSWRVPSFVAMGDIASARREITVLRELAHASAQPFMLHVVEHYGSAIALADGRLEDAEEMAARSHEVGRLLTGRDASGTYGIQVFSLRREQGRIAELAPVVRILAGSSRERGAWRPGLVSVLVELGMESEARRELTRIVREGLDQFRESLWLASLTYITDACAALGDAAAAALVYPELEPLTGTNVMIGHLVCCYGSADRYLGMLAATLGEWERAEDHFERAIALNREMGAMTWLAHTEYQYVHAMLAAGRRDPSLARALLGEARELATGLQLKSLLGRIDSLQEVAAPGRLPDGLSPREAEILRLVARGLSNREIGTELFISSHTAANHIRSILRKTGCGNRTEAASYAHRHALVDA
ncbi:MAG TPA: AAA family ATPase [Solirubrobacteraceae bacterium]|nr:AAA family ATPase [Solirubrobacteraceae bacterium]